jgi:azurin
MKIAQNANPGVEIILDNHTPQKTYTTFDPVTGVVQITAPQNIRFDEVKITLEGRSKTFVENFSTAGTRSRSVARHNFLKLTMPLNDSNYPQPRIAEAGITYSFPFNVS